MAINFPGTPNTGDEFTGGGFTWTWSGTSWEKIEQDTSSTAGTGFTLVLGSSGNTTFDLGQEQAAGAYSISSQLSDSSFEVYLIDSSNSNVGYTNTAKLSASSPFSKIVVYGGEPGDVLSFDYRVTAEPTASGNLDGGAAPYIDSLSVSDLPNIDDTVIINGGNFATNVSVTFVDNNNTSILAKNIVRASSSQLIVTRPDEMLESNAPYEVVVSNPGITQSAIRSHRSSVTAGGVPTWSTEPGDLDSGTPGVSYSKFLSANDPDGGTISYSTEFDLSQYGLSLNSSTGEISGTPLAAVPSFSVVATDLGGNQSSRSFSIPAEYATGGTITESNGYRIHTFTSSDTFSLLGSVPLDLLIVGGGGSGSSVNGGGAGGYSGYSSLTVSPGDYAIAVAGAGSSSSALSYSSGPGSGQTSGTGTQPRYGGPYGQSVGSGGGGTSGEGTAAVPYTCGRGGPGTSWEHGGTYGGGGGGGSNSSNSGWGGGSGGSGGGGFGGRGGPGGDGAANTGGGGGNGKSGGSGIVRIAYAI